MRKIQVGIIGAGIAGLVAAYELSKAGVQVTMLERSAKAGGLASSFVIEDGHEIEQYYHFICKPDHGYFHMLRELGLYNRLRWTTTKMGLYYNGQLHTLGDPLSLLRFPYLSVADKVRFGVATMRAKLSNSAGWRSLENIPAREWLVRAYGQRTYDMLYRPLLDQKFRQYAPQISAAWMWARLHRLGNSRTIMQDERLGYLEGGSQAYVTALENANKSRGVDIRLQTTVERVSVQEDGVIVMTRQAGLLRFNHVLCTVPLPYAVGFFDQINQSYFGMIRALEYVGVRVMILRLDRRFTRYFWMNVSDPRMDICGIIEYTNLNPCAYLGGDAIIYIPQYLPHDHPLYTMPDVQLFDLYCRYLAMVRPDFNPDWIKGYWVHQEHFAQPICKLGFSQHTPGIETPFRNLYVTDSCQLHPDDRTISNSSDLGRRAAHLILRNSGLAS